jgi:uncharacterized protein YndB with AHSA1/START domain
LTGPADISFTMHIDAPAEAVWNALTDPAMLRRWMSEEQLDIQSTFHEGDPISITGTIQGKEFANRGLIQASDPPCAFSYNYSSSLTGNDGAIDAVLEFRLHASGDATSLQFTASHILTPEVRGHLRFYWTVALQVMKRMVEKENVQIKETNRGT